MQGWYKRDRGTQFVVRALISGRSDLTWIFGTGTTGFESSTHCDSDRIEMRIKRTLIFGMVDLREGREILRRQLASCLFITDLNIQIRITYGYSIFFFIFSFFFPRHIFTLQFLLTAPHFNYNEYA